MILFEKEVIAALGLPSVPIKEWNGKDDFKDGVAVVSLYGDREAYAVATFDSAVDKKPRIKKVFGVERFVDVKRVYVVPDYMDTDVTGADLDDESKKRAEQLSKEADDIENDGIEMSADEEALPEWVFPNITNREEAEAFVRSYRQSKKIKGKIPQTEENLKTYLYVIYKELNEKAK